MATLRNTLVEVETLGNTQKHSGKGTDSVKVRSHSVSRRVMCPVFEDKNFLLADEEAGSERSKP